MKFNDGKTISAYVSSNYIAVYITIVSIIVSNHTEYNLLNFRNIEKKKNFTVFSEIGQILGRRVLCHMLFFVALQILQSS